MVAKKTPVLGKKVLTFKSETNVTIDLDQVVADIEDVVGERFYDGELRGDGDSTGIDLWVALNVSSDDSP